MVMKKFLFSVYQASSRLIISCQCSPKKTVTISAAQQSFQDFCKVINMIKMLFCSLIKVAFATLPFLSFILLSSSGFGTLFVNTCPTVFCKSALVSKLRNYIALFVDFLWNIEQGNFLLQDGSGKCNPTVLFIMCGNDSCMFVSDFRMHKTCYRNGIILMLRIFVITLFF